MIFPKIKELTASAIRAILAAESELRGKTGPEKRAWAVRWLTAAIDLPFVPAWLEAIICPVLYGAVVDAVVSLFNSVAGTHSFDRERAIADSKEETVRAAAAVAMKSIKESVPVETLVKEAALPEGLSLDGKFKMLIDKFDKKK